MQDKLRADIDSQHAPEWLVNATIEKLHTSRKKKTIVYALPTAVLVAAALFVCVSIPFFQTQMRYNQIEFMVMREMAMEEEVEVEHLTLGEGTLTIKSSDTSQVAPEELLQGKTTKVKGIEVYLGCDSEETYYMAAFSKDGVNYYLQARECEKGEFEKYLKNFFEQ